MQSLELAYWAMRLAKTTPIVTAVAASRTAARRLGVDGREELCLVYWHGDAAVSTSTLLGASLGEPRLLAK